MLKYYKSFILLISILDLYIKFLNAEALIVGTAAFHLSLVLNKSLVINNKKTQINIMWLPECPVFTAVLSTSTA